MRLFCRLCGARTDGRERLAVYCPGERCGTDLRAGADSGTQAWCEPARQRGEPGRTAVVRLTVRNAGPRADGYRLEPVEEVEGRLEYDRRALAAPLAPGQERTVELRFTPPRDRLGTGLDIASRFGVPAADLAGRARDAAAARFGVALRVESTTANQGAACAAFAVDVPGRLEWDQDDRAGPSSRAERGSGTRRGSGAGRSAVIAGVVAAVVAIAVVLALGLGVGTKGGVSASTGGGPNDPSPTAGGNGGGTGGNPAGGQSGGNPIGGSQNGGQNGGGKNGGNQTSGGQNGGNPGPSTPAPVTVPNLTGLTQEAAAAKLKALGLAVDGEYVESGGVPELQIISTIPKAGTKVLKGSSVFLKISDGKAKIPDVSGLTRAAAEAELKAKGFTNVTPQSKGTSDFTENTAISTDPPQGTVIGLTKPIILVFAVKPDRPR
ncbi:PASTA domain-containing protein [Kitasatospora sp. NPDC004240]